MVLKNIKQLLDKTEVPVAYDHWDEPPPLPYILTNVQGERAYGADISKNLIHDFTINIELYTDTKDLKIEAIVETALASFSYDKNQSWVDSEQLYVTYYTIEIKIKEK